MQTEGDLLRLEIKKSGKTQEEFSSHMGFSRNYLLRLMERAELPEDVKQKAANILKKSVHDIFGSVQNAHRDIAGTPIYELSATAGGNENISQLPEVPAFHVSIPGYEDCNFGMHVFGHSMYPTIETGSLVLCRKVQDKSVIMYGEIYLIRTKDYLMVKRLQKNGTKGHVLCTSDNFEKRSPEFKRFESFDIAIDKIIDLYLVKGLFVDLCRYYLSQTCK